MLIGIASGDEGFPLSPASRARQTASKRFLGFVSNFKPVKAVYDNGQENRDHDVINPIYIPIAKTLVHKILYVHE